MNFTKEHTERLDSLILTAVWNSWIFEGNMGGEYSIQTLLLDEIKPTTVKALGTFYGKRVKSLQTEEDFVVEEDSKESRELKEAEDKLKALKLIYRFKVSEVDRKKAEAIARKERREKAQLIKKIIAEKEAEDLKDTDLKKLKGMYDELSAE